MRSSKTHSNVTTFSSTWKRVLVYLLVFWLSFFLFLLAIQYTEIESFTQEEAFSFKKPSFFWYLLILIPFTAAFLWRIYWKSKRMSALASSSVLGMIIRPESNRANFLQFIALHNVLVFAILALAQPIFGTKKIEGKQRSSEVVICLDVSNSMNVKDLDAELSRLEIAKRAINQLVNASRGERIGIAIFAGEAYVQLPITSDYEAVKMFAQEIETDAVTFQGTNLSKALQVSTQMFTNYKGGKTILMLTDGEDHDSTNLTFLDEFSSRNIQLGILGIGSTAGGLIPNHPIKPELGFKTDENGKRILSILNPELVKSLAKATNGAYVFTSNPYPDLADLLAKAEKNAVQTTNSSSISVKSNHFGIPLGISLIFWIVYVLVRSGLISNRKA